MDKCNIAVMHGSAESGDAGCLLGIREYGNGLGEAQVEPVDPEDTLRSAAPPDIELSAVI